MVAKPSSRKNLIASLAVWLLILLYIGLFSWQSVARHQAFATAAYDLGNVNQAFWNTVHGQPLRFTNWRGVELDLASDNRLAMHVEPIYFVLAPIYWLWQQPETILILQTVILALGALPVFWLARDRLRSHLAGVAFAAVYLLYPGLEAANMWEFHAVALAAPLLLFAFYFGQKSRWGLLWLFALLAMATKEEVSLSVLVMGFCFAVWGLVQARRDLPQTGGTRAWLRQAARNPRVVHGLALMLVAAVWFYVAVFVVVPHFEGSRSPYLSYYNQLSGDAASGGGGVLAMLMAALPRRVHPAQRGVSDRPVYARGVPFGFQPTHAGNLSARPGNQSAQHARADALHGEVSLCRATAARHHDLGHPGRGLALTPDRPPHEAAPACCRAGAHRHRAGFHAILSLLSRLHPVGARV